MDIQIRKASRKSVPLLISVASVSGGGKTYSSLLLAAGIAGAKGRVGLIDTENGRGEMYADSPGIVKALPNGYEYARMDPDFSPKRYIQYISAMEKSWCQCLRGRFRHARVGGYRWVLRDSRKEPARAHA
jgi:hypothetical protein